MGALVLVRGVSQKTGARAHDPVGGDETGYDPPKENSGYPVSAAAHLPPSQAQAGRADVDDVRGGVFTLW